MYLLLCCVLDEINIATMQDEECHFGEGEGAAFVVPILVNSIIEFRC